MCRPSSHHPKPPEPARRGVTILTPAIIGMTLRRRPFVEELVKVNKDLMSKTTIIATASLPFLKVPRVVV